MSSSDSCHAMLWHIRSITLKQLASPTRSWNQLQHITQCLAQHQYVFTSQIHKGIHESHVPAQVISLFAQILQNPPNWWSVSSVASVQGHCTCFCQNQPYENKLDNVSVLGAH